MALRENERLTAEIYSLKSNMNSKINISRANEKNIVSEYQKELEHRKKVEKKLEAELAILQRSYHQLTSKFNSLKNMHQKVSSKASPKLIEEIKVGCGG